MKILRSASFDQIKIEKLQKEVLTALSKLDKPSENDSSVSSGANSDVPAPTGGDNRSESTT